MYVDRFGNLITSIRAGDLPKARTLTVRIEGREIHGLTRTFGEGEALVALIGAAAIWRSPFPEAPRPGCSG